jgi:hypothetical protein
MSNEPLSNTTRRGFLGTATAATALTLTTPPAAEAQTAVAPTDKIKVAQLNVPNTSQPTAGILICVLGPFTRCAAAATAVFRERGVAPGVNISSVPLPRLEGSRSPRKRLRYFVRRPPLLLLTRSDHRQRQQSAPPRSKSETHEDRQSSACQIKEAKGSGSTPACSASGERRLHFAATIVL